ncbi:hypothetical protein ABT263_25055 [Kitasatospora sp. NPDC001603]|uniref:hypothetical protein n=1 Tax=Kitasatospora sp. NPDC001603 TaxID=3154388 RepID=UPI00331DB31E
MPTDSSATTATELAALAGLIATALRDPALLDRYHAAQDRTAPIRPATALPSHVCPAQARPELRVRLLLPRARLETAGQVLRLHGGGRTWELSASLRPLIATLLDHLVTTLGHIAAECEIPVGKAAGMLPGLVQHGLVSVSG